MLITGGEELIPCKMYLNTETFGWRGSWIWQTSWVEGYEGTELRNTIEEGVAEQNFCCSTVSYLLGVSSMALLQRYCCGRGKLRSNAVKEADQSLQWRTSDLHPACH